MKPSIYLFMYLSFQLYWTTCKSISSECKKKKRKREEAKEEGERKLKGSKFQQKLEKKATKFASYKRFGQLGQTIHFVSTVWL